MRKPKHREVKGCGSQCQSYDYTQASDSGACALNVILPPEQKHLPWSPFTFNPLVAYTFKIFFGTGGAKATHFMYTPDLYDLTELQN